MGLARSLVLVAAACSSGKPKAVEDAKRPAPDDAITSTTPRDAAVPRPPSGDVQIRVEWTNPPLAARTSPGTSTCGTPLAPQVSPTTTWGIPDVLVFVDGAPITTIDASVRYADCAITPRVAVGARLAVDSASDRPVTLALQPEGAKDARDARVIALPIAGHHVVTEIAAGAHRVEVKDVKAADAAWIASPSAAVTDASGVVLVKDVPVGVHAVRAWLPPRGNQKAREAKGEVTVVADDLAELTLTLD